MRRHRQPQTHRNVPVQQQRLLQLPVFLNGIPVRLSVRSKHKKRPWYSSDSLLAARLPIGFVMHIGAHLLTVYYSIVVQLVVVPLMYWEVCIARWLRIIDP